jgi:fibro-slime domain-containing protein
MRMTRGLIVAYGISIALLGACGSSTGSTRAPGEEAGTGSTSTGNGGATGSGGGSVAFGGTGPLTFGGQSQQPDCSGPNPPAECATTSKPGCGDGHKNQAGEDCDDGNSIPGDGCSGVCKVEPYHSCPVEGMPCISEIVCGDGMIGPGEACDDKNTVSGDGCSAKCNLVEKGFNCRVPGVACSRVFLCGDGTPDPNEGCDDGGKMDGDGCDAKCRVEPGFKCSGTPSACSPTKCGDGKAEGAESCDDGNLVPFDGCSVDCQAEPACATGTACTSKCGDGIVLNEECDDGNLRDGDGCSSKCKVEVDQGFKCNNDAPCVPEANGQCALHVPAIFRDFKGSKDTGGHPDFEQGGKNRLTITGLVKKDLDAEGKPIYAGGTNVALIKSVDSFAQWYRTSAINKELVGEVVLWDNGKGGYVNRFGPNGEQFKGYPATVKGNPADETPGVNKMSRVYQCQQQTVTDPVTLETTNIPASCVADPVCAAPAADEECEDRCLGYGGAAQNFPCVTTVQYFDGQPLFFPVDSLAAGTQYSQVTPAYAYNWVSEDQIPQVTMPKKHNFSFTSEVKYWFKYDAAATPAQLDFTGDDDVWVFINGHLAVDIGGYHIPQNGSVTIDRAHATTFGLEDGKVYQIAIFQAERQTLASSFRLTLSGFNATPSDCSTNCGDGKIAPGEECDDGTDKNTGEYDHCSATCTLGPRCGDAAVQMESGEQCDLGADGNTGAYKGCAPNCQPGPHCGDSVVQTQYEKCDDGKNTGEYGTCNADCSLAPHCGDGVQQSDQGEECDDGNSEPSDGCNPACKLEILR